MSPISLCYHPTTTLFIDDNQDFLEAIKLKIGNSLPCKVFNNPLKALSFLQNEYHVEPFIQRCFIESVDEEVGHLLFNVDLRKIHKEVDIGERFDEIAVAVIDYTMPGMNGLELAKQIRAINTTIRILLLTGDADHDLAVQAFNEGSIDKFIKKDTSELIANVLQSIRQLESQYFQTLSQIIFDKLFIISDKLSRLRDPSFVKLFHDICQEKNIVEYYIVDDGGSFLLINKLGASHWLALLNGEELEEFYYYAKNEGASESVVEALKSKAKVPFFYSEKDLHTLPADWGKYLHPAQRVVGKDTYYYALIK